MQEYAIDGVLDLHVFAPSDVDSLVSEYRRACNEKDLTEVRIIHGKGTGTLRREVRSILDDQPLVAYLHKAMDQSGWGPTIAHMLEISKGGK